jgi:(2Fe-2S) ferredoxin
MGPFEKHVFVCSTGPICPVDADAKGLHARLKQLVSESGLSSRIRINNAGCFDQCGHGPMIVVYPENVWYGGVQLQDADEIFHEHLVGQRPVERLLYRPAKPGGNKVKQKPG